MRRSIAIRWRTQRRPTLRGDDLLRFIRACGHEPSIVTLGGAASAGFLNVARLDKKHRCHHDLQFAVGHHDVRVRGDRRFAVSPQVYIRPRNAYFAIERPPSDKLGLAARR